MSRALLLALLACHPAEDTPDAFASERQRVGGDIVGDSVDVLLGATMGEPSPQACVAGSVAGRAGVEIGSALLSDAPWIDGFALTPYLASCVDRFGWPPDVAGPTEVVFRGILERHAREWGEVEDCRVSSWVDAVWAYAYGAGASAERALSQDSTEATVSAVGREVCE